MARPEENKITPPGPRFDEVLAVKILGTLATAGMIVALAFFFSRDTGPIRLSSPAPTGTAERDLLAELTNLRTTWDETQRERILAAAPANRIAFAAPLQRILRTTDHSLIVEATEYAGALATPELRRDLVELVFSRNEVPVWARHQAVLSADKLLPWEAYELEELLTEGQRPVCLATLQLIGERGAGPWDLVLDFLADDTLDEALRRAAAQAIPKELPAGLRHRIWRLLERGNETGVRIGLAALARTRLDDDLVARVVALVDELDGDLKIACLELLGNRGITLPEPSPIWKVVTDHRAGLPMRARALYCLEQTRSFDAPDLRAAGLSEPVLRHFAARCLIAKGDAAGLEDLLDLVDSEESDASIASRRLLAWLTGRSPSATRKEFQDELSGRSNTLSRRSLPEPSYDFGG